MAAPKLNAPLLMVPMTTKELGWEEYPNYCLTILNSPHFSSFFFLRLLNLPELSLASRKPSFYPLGPA